VFFHEGPARAEIEQWGQPAAGGVARVGVDDPFPPPGRGQLDAVVVHRHDLEAEPAMIGRAGDELLHALERGLLAHGATTTLPMTSRSWIRRSPSLACSRGSTLSITGRISPAAISFISACRSSS